MASSMRTPLGRVRGHGAAKSGTGHFIAERVTSIALFFLAPWFVLAIALGGVNSYDSAIAFLRTPFNAVGVILLIAVSFHHMALGMQVIIEDYIEKHGARIVLLLANAFLCVVAAATGIFAVLRISMGA